MHTIAVAVTADVLVVGWAPVSVVPVCELCDFPEPRVCADIFTCFPHTDSEVQRLSGLLGTTLLVIGQMKMCAWEL